MGEDFKNFPSHLKFASPLFKKVAKEKFGRQVCVQYIYMRGFGALTLKEKLKLTQNILSTKHDVLYYGTDPTNLIFMSILKKFGLYKRPMYAWKYTVIGKTGNKIKDLSKKILYSGFNKIFMLTEKHVQDSYSQGLVKISQLKYMKWGEDIDYINQLNQEKNPQFTFISTGKAYRDFKTLIKAFCKIDLDVRLRLYLPQKWGSLNYSEDLGTIAHPNIDICHVRGKRIPMEEIYKDLLKSHCALCICKPVDFGVGYTQVLDSLACGLPVIWTYNKDNPIDVEATNTGILVPPQDADALAKAMIDMVNDKNRTKQMSENATKLVEYEYNIRLVAEKILECIFEDTNHN